MSNQSTEVSFYKNIILVQLFYVCFNLLQLLFIAFLSAFETDGVDNSDMCEFLILFIDLIPFVFESFSDGIHFFIWETIFVHLMFFMEIPYHFVFVVNVFFDLMNVCWSLSIVFLLCPVDWFWCSFGDWKYVLNGIWNNEILPWSQSLDWFLMNTWDRCFFMIAIIWEVLRYWQLLITHRSCFRFQKLLWVWFSISFQLTQCFGLTELSMSL